MSSTPSLDLKSLRKLITDGTVDTVLVVFPDTYGRLVGKRLVADYFVDHCAESGTHGCNYLLTVDIEMDPQEGFELASWERGFGDFAMKPDLSTLRPIPWLQKTALVICDLQRDDGSVVNEAPRNVLRKQIDRLAAQGLTCNCASELEFFVFNGSYADAFASRYSNLKPSSDYRIDYNVMQTSRDEPIMRAMRQQMPLAGVPVESTKGEWGRGQHEINFVY